MPSDDPKIEKDVTRTTVDDKFAEVKPPSRKAAATAAPLTVAKVTRYGVSKTRPWGGVELTLSTGATVFVDLRTIEEAPWATPAVDDGV